MPAIITLLLGDITHEAVDAIVNAANSSLMGGGGVDGAIHRAGGPSILEECRKIVAKIGRLETGGAVITGGGKLAARHVIHAVGPRYRDGKHGESALLESAYREAIARAAENALQVISFPSISTGIYGYPVEEAAPIALVTVFRELKTLGPGAEGRFVLFDRETFRIYREAAKERLPPESWRLG